MALSAAIISGDIHQNKREQLLKKFHDNEYAILVATDVASRGLHIPDVTHVFNYDLPELGEDYVHRIGRTARAGKSGAAVSFACEDYAMNLIDIESYTRRTIPTMSISNDLLIDPQTAGKMKGGRIKPSRWQESHRRPGHRKGHRDIINAERRRYERAAENYCSAAAGLSVSNLRLRSPTRAGLVTVPSRRPHRHRSLLVHPNISLLEADIIDPAGLKELCDGQQAVINLVGILHERRKGDFRRFHVEFIKSVVEACSQTGIKRLLHVSALGADQGPAAAFIFAPRAKLRTCCIPSVNVACKSPAFNHRWCLARKTNSLIALPVS